MKKIRTGIKRLDSDACNLDPAGIDLEGIDLEKEIEIRGEGIDGIEHDLIIIARKWAPVFRRSGMAKEDDRSAE
jgi:hypothetical protein